jgi:hypothetical protein
MFTNLSFRYGRLQYLNEARFKAIGKMVFTHQIPQYVCRKLEKAIDHGGWEAL